MYIYEVEIWVLRPIKLGLLSTDSKNTNKYWKQISNFYVPLSLFKGMAECNVFLIIQCFIDRNLSVLQLQQKRSLLRRGFSFLRI
jgi:hypothetical protein